jgi:hypothetical protein
MGTTDNEPIDDPVDYPPSRRPKSAPPRPPAIETQVEQYLRGLTTVQLAQLLTLVRGGR